MLTMYSIEYIQAYFIEKKLSAELDFKPKTSKIERSLKFFYG